MRFSVLHLYNIVHNRIILIDHIHALAGVGRILLDFSLDICLSACHYIADESLVIKGEMEAPQLPH